MSNARIVKKQITRWIVIRAWCCGATSIPKSFRLSRSTLRAIRRRVDQRIARYGDRA